MRREDREQEKRDRQRGGEEGEKKMRKEQNV